MTRTTAHSLFNIESELVTIRYDESSNFPKKKKLSAVTFCVNFTSENCWLCEHFSDRWNSLEKKKRESSFDVFAFIFIVFSGNYESSLVVVNNFGNAITAVRVWKVVDESFRGDDDGRSAHQTRSHAITRNGQKRWRTENEKKFRLRWWFLN